MAAKKRVTTKETNTGKKKGQAKKQTNDRKVRIYKILGILSCIVSILLFFSFLSYIINYETDYDLISKGRNSLSGLLFNSEYKADNAIGKLGLWTGYLFITRWFGVASFLFVPYLFVIGLRLLEAIPKFRLGVFSRQMLFFLIWISVATAFIFGARFNFSMGGAFGLTCCGYLTGLIGRIGTGLLIFAILITYLLLEYDFVMNWIDNLKVAPEVREQRKEQRRQKKEERKQEKLARKAALGAREPEETPYNIEEYAIEEDFTERDEIPLHHNGTIELETDTDFEVYDATANDPDRKKEAEPAVAQDDIEFSINEIVPENSAAIPCAMTEETEEDKKHFGIDTPFDPTLDLPDFQFPKLNLLENYDGDNSGEVNAEELNANKKRIVETLNNYNIAIEKIKATIGPTVTLYEIVPAAGIRISRIKNLEDDIALSLAALGIRIIAPIPGKGTIGIEVPNSNPSIVSMKSVLASEKFQNTKHALPIALGKTIANETYVADLAKMPHLLMAGATGQGKSVGINAVIASLLYKKHPAELKFVLIDPKKVELSLFSKIERHYLAKLPNSEEAIITDTRRVVNTLNSLVVEMDNRYELLKDAQVRNIREYNAKFIERKLNPLHGHRFLPYIVLIVDEFADLIMTAGREVENPIARLAQLSRAIGIHLIIATQRPSVNIITGVIKANFPARIAFRVTAKVDSRTILDTGGADQLIGRGDMLLSTGSDIIRLQCAFIDTPEVERMTEYIGAQRGYPSALILPEIEEENAEAKEFDESDRDPLFEDAARVIVQAQQGSTSLLQRKLKLGYNRAGRLIDQLEAAGIVGPFEGSKAREVRVANEEALEQFLKDLNL